MNRKFIKANKKSKSVLFKILNDFCNQFVENNYVNNILTCYSISSSCNLKPVLKELHFKPFKRENCKSFHFYTTV